MWHSLLATNFDGLPQEALEQLEPLVQSFIKQGQELTAVDFMKANFARQDLYDKLNRLFEKYDLLLVPTTGTPAFPLSAGMGVKEIEGKKVDQFLGWALTYPFNLTGNPIGNVPVGFSDGLPVGMQIVGQRYEDALVMRAALAYERLAPWEQHYKKLKHLK
jgi:Asp-tRNA(Asn)/Glu-tRNA(Gln) amidotransferase A subunit family amidase